MGKTLKEQAEIVEQRLNYHFGNVDGGYNIPQQMPFMIEIIKEINKLCVLAKLQNENSNCNKPLVSNNEVAVCPFCKSANIRVFKYTCEDCGCDFCVPSKIAN